MALAWSVLSDDLPRPPPALTPAVKCQETDDKERNVHLVTHVFAQTLTPNTLLQAWMETLHLRRQLTRGGQPALAFGEHGNLLKAGFQ